MPDVAERTDTSVRSSIQIGALLRFSSAFHKAFSIAIVGGVRLAVHSRPEHTKNETISIVGNSDTHTRLCKITFGYFPSLAAAHRLFDHEKHLAHFLPLCASTRATGAAASALLNVSNALIVFADFIGATTF